MGYFMMIALLEDSYSILFIGFYLLTFISISNILFMDNAGIFI